MEGLFRNTSVGTPTKGTGGKAVPPDEEASMPPGAPNVGGGPCPPLKLPGALWRPLEAPEALANLACSGPVKLLEARSTILLKWELRA